jgi:8-oxo-dGTP pyrophosphatase MutT (NUDIX family)
MTSDNQDREYNFERAVKKIGAVLKKYQPQRVEMQGVYAAAVMILIVNRKQIPHIIFTKRTDTVETHKGQISFPGGVQEPQDRNLLETGTRETFEEIGIQADLIENLGQLDDFYTVTDYVVSPFVGYLNSDFEYRLNTHEVAHILEVPLPRFLTADDFEVRKWDHQGTTYDVFFYHYQDQVIWGATAYILNRFIDIVFGFNPAPHPVIRDPRNDHYLRENIHRKSGR